MVFRLLLLTSTYWICWSTMAQDVRLMQYSNNVTSMVNDSGTTATASMARSSGSAEVPPDSVSSLRALALSTLRSKRRKDTTSAAAVSSHSLPARPLPPDIGNVFLDYGTETKEEQDSLVPSTLSEDRKPAISSISQAAFDAEVKEEGEISDEEFCASSIASSTSPKHSAKDANHGLKSLPSTKATRLATTPIKIEPQKSPPSPNEQHLRQSSVAPQDRGIWNSWVPSEDHVRPGLKMNMEQFNLAKELILDLLGWGVSPEYLVDCGLTREAVFYTFMELNLKLPRNLDVSGFLPSPSPPAPTSKNDGQVSPIDAQRASLGHPLPAKPPTQAPSMTSPTTASTPQQTHPNGQNLSDMEARRRLELQARKAVLASRRKKAMPSSAEPSVPATSSVTPTVLDGSIVDEPEPIVPATAIDDFLKSMIETTSTSSQSSTPVSAHKARTLSGGVPLGVSSSTSSTVPTGSPVTSTFPASAPMDMDTKQDAMDGLLQADPVPSRPESFIDGMISVDPASARKTTVTTGDSTPVLATPQVSDRPSRNAIPPTAPREMRSKDSFTSGRSNVQVTNGRRGTKRPVAMDFVDVEHDPASQHGASMSAQPPSVRRKLGSFAGLGSHASRRCVIDLSDSEGDDEHDEIVTEKQFSQFQQAPASTLNTFRAVVTPTPAPRLPSTRPASTAGLRPPQSASPALSPEALEEKERQIKQMRELIARREQERLRKFAEKSRTPAATPPHYSSTPGSVGVEPLPPPTVSISMKAEDVNRSSPNTSTSKLVYQPSRSESSASDQADEDVVMQTLEPSGPSVPFPAMDDKSAHTREVNAETLANAESGKPMDVTHQDTPSAQVEFRQDGSQSFTQYISPFSYYPLLRSRTRVVSDLGPDTFHTSTTSARPSVSSSCISSVVDPKITVPDLRPLKVAVASREVGDGEGRRICQFEVPGGGVCADETCTDLHINDLEPDDHEIARYLREVMPDVLQAYDETELVDQLLQARQKNSNATKTSSQAGSSTSLANRVSEAISALLGSTR
ncbi:hypothetical protein A7U60_g4653 [Sanghuangporus baumii]|uniref:Zinc-finger domain-containing protein n=1 Tax=Sanghuangporus baumii TaxID=108892 RepID=A0A9Q5N4X9_SANBA|nr:hypothetical protein A7U60_g4653 [Sanghuangporus baumii]